MSREVRRVPAGLIALVLLASLFADLPRAEPAAAAPTERSVAGQPLPAWAAPPDPEGGAAAPLPAPRWPAAGEHKVVASKGGTEVLDRAAALSLGGELAFRVVNSTGAAGVDVDYSGFRYAYGGNFADRLRLVRVGSDGSRAFVAARNDPASGHLSAEVDGGLYLLVAATAGADTGDYRATDLRPSGKWQVGLQSGSFRDSYPLELPPSIGGDVPALAFGYDSGSVDGRTSATNNQASWVGLGWDLGAGFIERKYRSCVDDGDPFHADLCWSSPYPGDEDGAAYVISLDGVTTELIRAADGSYRMRDDRGWRIEHRFDGANDDNTDEYWVVSTPDGAKHRFGYRTDSNLTVPVVGDDAGEPCQSTKPVPCRQSWRWGLDQTVDANENVVSFYWTKETNNYKQANGGATYKYDRAGFLDRVEYGGLAGEHPAAQVDFTAALRCTQRVANPASPCPAVSAANATSYPDVPVDLVCADGASCTKPAPSFFLTSRLESIASRIWDSGTQAWQDVSRWTPTYAFPGQLDGNSPSLWLNSIQRTGISGTEQAAQPATSFDGIFLANRQDYTSTPQQLQMRRVSVIRNGLGGETRISYGHASVAVTCPPGENPNWEAGMVWDQNRFECFRVRFKPDGSTSQIKGVFHKYVVTKVDDVDLVAGSPTQTTTYAYGVDGLVPFPAWHRDDELLVPAADQDWTDWRGYQTVRVTEGTGGADRQTITDTRFFRGMNGDLLGSGSPKTETVRDYAGRAWPDDPQLAGQVLQTQGYTRSATGVLTELESSRHTYWDSGVLVDGPGPHDVRMVRPLYTYERDQQADGSWRETSTVDDGYTVANGGLATRHADLGETGVTDSTCTEITYAQNTSGANWLLEPVERSETHAGDPDATTAECLGPVIDRTITLYDGASGTGDGVNEPTDGNPTEVRSFTAEGTYSFVKYGYDGYGRQTSETDAAGTSTTRYTPASGFPTEVAEIDPAGSMTRTTPSRRFDGAAEKIVDVNSNTTELDRDPLGRLRKVWLPTEPRSGPATQEFAYRITAGKPTVVTAKQLLTPTTSVATYTYLDGFGRTREVQAPSPGGSGGRTVVVTLYDERGLSRGTSAPMWNSIAPADDANLLLNPATTAIPSWTEATYDALEREVTSTVWGLGVAAARTQTAQFGNGSVVTPPVGGSTGTWLDGHGRTATVQQDLPAGATLPQPGKPTSAYTYHPSGEVATVTDPAGNVTRYEYDWLGHVLSTVDPNAGTRLSTYDSVGRLKTVTDAKGQKLTYTYDPLDRKRMAWAGEEQTGTKLAEWTYDTVPGAIGQLATTTRYADGNAYTTSVTGYDKRYQPTGERWTIPAAETGLGGTYDIGYGYDRAGHLTTISYPAAGGLPAETVTQTYTGTGVAASLSSDLGSYVQATGYAGSGQLASRTLGATGSVTRTYTFEPTGAQRLSGVSTTSGGNTVQDDSFSYDAGNNPVRVLEKLAGQSQCFSYDNLLRLSASWTTGATDCAGGIAAADSTGPDPFREQYRYNSAGSLTTVTAGSASRVYTYPASGPDSVRPHAVSTIGADTFGYDPNGAEISRTVAGTSTTFGYDEFGRLASSTTAGAVTTIRYDADGERLLRREPGATTLYLDGMELRRTSTGGLSATRYYRTGGDLVAQRTGAGVTWLLTDQQGSVQLAIPAGTAFSATAGVTRQRYLPYGSHRGQDDLTTTDYGYLGKLEDASTGLVALDNRQHDPAAGQLTSPDPMMDLDDPRGQNAYAYANDNPAALSDPTGMSPYCHGIQCTKEMKPPAPSKKPKCWGWECTAKSWPKPKPRPKCWGWECTAKSWPKPKPRPKCWGWECTARSHPRPKPSCWGWECTARSHPKPKQRFVRPPDYIAIQLSGSFFGLGIEGTWLKSREHRYLALGGGLSCSAGPACAGISGSVRAGWIGGMNSPAAPPPKAIHDFIRRWSGSVSYGAGGSYAWVNGNPGHFGQWDWSYEVGLTDPQATVSLTGSYGFTID